jgi:hypothetical protein
LEVVSNALELEDWISIGKKKTWRLRVAVPLPTISTVKNGGNKPQFDGQRFIKPEKTKGLVKVRSDVLFGTMIVGPLRVNAPPTIGKKVPLRVAPPRMLEPAKNPPTLMAAPLTQGEHHI